MGVRAGIAGPARRLAARLRPSWVRTRAGRGGAWRLAALLALASAEPLGAQRGARPAAAERYDLILRGGTVVDGTGNPGYVADVGIRGDRIARIGKLGDAAAGRVVDATGLVVSPGFIDPHSHAIGRIFQLPTADGYVLQGITTVTDGNDGGSPLPLGPFMDSVARLKPSLNLAFFVGHGSVRRAVMGTANRAPTAQELERMKGLVAQAMRDGALGLSTGLAYVPGQYAKTEEVIELAKVAAQYGGIYISHMRDEGGGVLASVKETIRIGEEAGIPVQISHHKVGGRKQFGQSVQSLALMREARSRGADITFDQYPYTASSTGLGLIIPGWAQADNKLEERLTDPAQAAKIRAGMLAFIDERFGDDPSKIQLVRCRSDSSLAGRTMADALKADGKPLTQDAVADKVLELQRDGGCSAIFHSYDEGDVIRLMRSNYGMIGTDGALSLPGDGSPHPRAFGTYPRVLGRYVREQGALPLESAIRKMTSFPAQRLGLQDRGLVREGMVADLTVFDPKTVIDRATYTEPRQNPIGIEYVMVSGQLVVDRGTVTGARPGQVLFGPARRGAGIPRADGVDGI